MIIGVGLLSILSPLDSSSDLANNLDYFTNHDGAQYFSLDNFIPIKRGSTLHSVQCLEEHRINGCLIAIILGKLD